MESRKGEKFGWTGGWIGGFLWVFILSIIFLFQAKYMQGVSGLLLTAIAIIIIVLFSPWKYPDTQYWKLMILPYILFIISIGWTLLSFDAISSEGFNWWNFTWLIMLLLPFGILSKRKWNDTP